MSLYNISCFKTTLGYFTLKTYEQDIVNLYPSKNRKIKIENKNDIHENLYINLNKYFSKQICHSLLVHFLPNIHVSMSSMQVLLNIADTKVHF